MTASCTAATTSSPLATGSGASEDPAEASWAASAITSWATSSAGSSVGISAGGGSIGWISTAGSTGSSVESVSAVSRTTVRTEPERRRRAIDPAGTRAVKPCTIAEPPSDVPAEALDEPLGGARLAGLGSHDDEHAVGRRLRRLGAQQREHERKGEEWTDGREQHARHIGVSYRSFSDFFAPLPGEPQNARKQRRKIASRRWTSELEHQSSRVARRRSSAVARASRIGPSSKRSTSSAMKPSITSRVELALSSPRERR